MNIADWITDAESRGLKLAVDADRLLVSPRASITESDRAFIVASKPLLLAFLATRKRKESSSRTCSGVCPGEDSGMCCGVCDVLEYLMPDGLISAGWCLNGNDVRAATHYRNRWDVGEWIPVKVAS